MDNITRVRNLIGDQHKSDVITLVGDGNAKIYQLPRKKLKTDSVAVTSGAISTVNHDTGLLTLVDPVDDFEKFQVQFIYSAFRDEEISEYLTANHSVRKAAIELIQILMADAARRYDYSTGLEQFRPSQIFEQLRKLLETLQSQNNDLGFSGGAKLENRTTDYGRLNNLYDDNEPTGY